MKPSCLPHRVGMCVLRRRGRNSISRSKTVPIRSPGDDDDVRSPTRSRRSRRCRPSRIDARVVIAALAAAQASPLDVHRVQVDTSTEPRRTAGSARSSREVCSAGTASVRTRTPSRPRRLLPRGAGLVNEIGSPKGGETRHGITPLTVRNTCPQTGKSCAVLRLPSSYMRRSTADVAQSQVFTEPGYNDGRCGRKMDRRREAALVLARKFRPPLEQKLDEPLYCEGTRQTYTETPT